MCRFCLGFQWLALGEKAVRIMTNSSSHLQTQEFGVSLDFYEMHGAEVGWQQTTFSRQEKSDFCLHF